MKWVIRKLFNFEYILFNFIIEIIKIYKVLVLYTMARQIPVHLVQTIS